MNTQKAEGKASESEDGDHAQPINLAAPRPPAPSTVVSGLAAQVANQPVALRPHGEAPKTGLMTLYFRTPTTTRPSAQGHIVSPMMGAQVASPQHFTAKQGTLKSFKSMRVNYYQDKLTDKGGGEFNIKVIRVPPPDSVQSPSGSNAPSATTMSPGILPNALTGNSSRHIIPAAVHPGISTGSAVSASMASIIKAGHQMSQVSHAIHQPFSSHVPRGPAAVASISAGPRSGVATPIVRGPHSSGTMTLASSMISPSSHVRVRSQTMTPGRAPIASSAAYAQVIDLQKNSIGHSLASNQAQMGQNTRSLDMSSSIRTSMQHPSAITIAKPINISQPIVQHLQQVSEKGCLKTVSGITTTSASSNSTPAHQNTTVLSSGHSNTGEVHSVCIVPTITRATVSSSSAYTTGIVQFPGAAISQHVPALRPSLVQPQALTSGMNISSSQGNQAFAVISAKSLPPNNQSVNIGAAPCRPSVSTNVGVPSCGSAVTSGSSATPAPTRVLSAPSPASHAAIPIAKVYPQPPATISQSSPAASGEVSRPSAFVTQAANLSGTLKSVTSTTAATTTAVSSVLHTSTIAKRSDSTTSVRFTPLTKQQVSSSYSGSSGSYVYDQCSSSLPVHPYSVATSNQGFSSSLPASHIQTFSLPQHGTSVTTASHPSVGVPASTSAVQPLNSLMVVTDSRHVTLPYNRVTIGAGKTVTDLPTHSSTTVTTTHSSSNLVALSQASSTHGTNHSQGAGVINHLSPRPSILRKRTALENVNNSSAKRNLISSICSLDPGSPNEEPVVNTPAALSPKPSSNGQLRENGIHLSSETENCRLPVPCPPITVKKEAVEESIVQDESMKDLLRPVEASPRKKPRKQLLAAIELTETHSLDADEHFEMKKNREIKTENDSDVKWVVFAKRPTMSLLSTYRQSFHSWKARHNHFSRYSDVKPKEEKQILVSELASQRGIAEEINGWKVHHVTGQTDDLSLCEEMVYSRLSHWLDLEKKNSPSSVSLTFSSEEMKIANKLADLVKGNLQRSKIAQEQAIESQQQLIKILDHKQNVTDILSKYTSRRQAKKKEKS